MVRGWKADDASSDAQTLMDRADPNALDNDESPRRRAPVNSVDSSTSPSERDFTIETWPVADDERRLMQHPSSDKDAKLASVPVTFVNLLKGNVGAGFLAMPFAFRNVGSVGGAVGVLVVSAAVVLGMRLLVQCKVCLRDQHNVREAELTYPAIGERLLGPVGKGLILACIFMSQIGTCTAYLIFFASVTHATWPEISRYSAMIIALCMIYPLVIIRNLRNLWWTSFLGCAIVATVVGVVATYEAVRLGEAPSPETPQDSAMINTDITHFPRFFGITVFAIEGITVVLPLEASIRRKHLFLPTLYASMAVVTTLLCGFGLLGYFVFGTVTRSMVTANLPSNNYVTALECLLVISLVCTFPIQLFPVTQVVDAWLLPEPGSSGYEPMRLMLRALLCIAIAHLAWLVPNFGDILAVVGGLAIIAIGIIFPCILYIVLFKSSLTFAQLAGLIILTAQSLALSILVTTTSVWDLVEHATTRPH